MKLVKAPLRHAVRRLIPRRELPPAPPTGHLDWAKLIDRDRRLWRTATNKAKSGPKVLIGTSLGGFAPGTVFEGFLAAALTLRGANVGLLLCDRILSACQLSVIQGLPGAEEFVEFGPSVTFCPNCYDKGHRAYVGLGLPIHLYSQYLTPGELSMAKTIATTTPAPEIRDFTLNGIGVGEHAYAGTLRFYARGDLENEPQGEAVLRRYFEAALMTSYAMDRLYTTNEFKIAVYHHGIYVPQGLIEEVGRQKNVRLVTWTPGYRRRRFILTHGETYHRALMEEPVENWQDMPWSEALEADLMSYLKSRWHHINDWIWFHEDPQLELKGIEKDLGVDFSKPCIGMLTNIIWDALLHYQGTAFPDMLDWTLQTIRYFGTRPDLQLIVRLHPAESRGTLVSRQLLLDEIHKAFPILPSNVFLIPADSPISTYAVMQQCNAALIFATKTGIEIAAMGVPVITAGEAISRNKGIEFDVRTPEEYFGLLDRLPFRDPPEDAKIERARRFAYHFFFRRMIPLEMFEQVPGWPPYEARIEGIADLMPGHSRGLDIICDGILNGSEFTFPAETYGAIID